MATIYAKRIKANLMTIDEVPDLWKEKVEKLLRN